MRKLRTIQDVVDWGLCMGCGACYYYCSKGAVTLVDIESLGIRPKFRVDLCSTCHECLSICPGHGVDVTAITNRPSGESNHSSLIGHTIEIFEGYAKDPVTRLKASSGGILSALASYCLENEQMSLVLHTGIDPEKPWANRTVTSRNRGELLQRCGSRYAPSSPCESLALIEKSEKPCVFIGKPCDAAAVSILRRKHPVLDEKLGLVLTFFCAGTPCTQGVLDLLQKQEVPLDEVNEVTYRGEGWPGLFKVVYRNHELQKCLSYEESWGYLSKYRRSFRCHLCPDGLGELADISCGDAWHRYPQQRDNGRSIILVRTHRGNELLKRATKTGYVDLTPIKSESVITAQGLVNRRKEIFGRLLAMQMIMMPIPLFRGFHLAKEWLGTPFSLKVRTILGTLRRLLVRGLWHRNPVQ